MIKTVLKQFMIWFVLLLVVFRFLIDTSDPSQVKSSFIFIALMFFLNLAYVIYKKKKGDQ